MSKEKLTPQGINGQKPPKRKMNFAVLGRVIKFLFKSYPKLLSLACVCIVRSAVVASIPAIFTQKVLSVITDFLDN